MPVSGLRCARGRAQCTVGVACTVLLLVVETREARSVLKLLPGRVYIAEMMSGLGVRGRRRMAAATHLCVGVLHSTHKPDKFGRRGAQPTCTRQQKIDRHLECLLSWEGTGEAYPRAWR